MQAKTIDEHSLHVKRDEYILLCVYGESVVKSPRDTSEMHSSSKISVCISQSKMQKGTV